MNQFGQAGEKFAAEYLERNGLRVLQRNWRGIEGEIDIIAIEETPQGNELVFCEVKSRHDTRWGYPVEAVNGQKQRRLRRAAGEYLSSVKESVGVSEIRFDVIEVIVKDGMAELDHLRDAF